MFHESGNRAWISRRGLFGLGGFAAGVFAVSPLSARPRMGFTHGVASGEPGPDRALLWTRYVGVQDTRLRYEVARDPDFTHIVADGEVLATPDRDWCAKAQPSGLPAGEWLYFRFSAPDGSKSAVGRTRTLPQSGIDAFRMAVFSCANLGFGWFNAYAHAAAAGEFDLAIHTGDYLYEYPVGEYPARRQAIADRLIAPDNETVSLTDYRLRYAAYRDDPDLQRLHQLYPMVLVWDDHESANDAWQDGAENHQPESEGDWAMRKAMAIRAYREWLPVSEQPWAAYEIGDLATLFRLETRLTARSKPFTYADILKGKGQADEIGAALVDFRDGAFRDPSRGLLGSQQESWLADGFARSRAAGKPWQVLAQQVVMGKLATPPIFGAMESPGLADNARALLRATAAAGRAGLPFNLDAWDGYPVARERLLASAREAESNLVVLTGDSHNGWAFELDHAGEGAGIEFAGQSVTSPGLEHYLGVLRPELIENALVSHNSQLKWADTAGRGYMAVELTPERASAEYRFVDGVSNRTGRLSRSRKLTSKVGSQKLKPV